MGGAEMFGLTIISEGLKSFFAYLPKLITALAIFVGGAYLGTMVKKAIQTMFKSLEITGGNLIGNIAFYLIVVFNNHIKNYEIANGLLLTQYILQFICHVFLHLL